MKYEITEGLYCDFFNSLTTSGAQQTQNTITSGGWGKNTNNVKNRNTVAISSGVCTTTRPDRALGYLSWPTFAAILDWLALRPMTELEYEKIARGPNSPVAGEFAWGNAGTIGNVLSFVGSPEDGTETAATALGANVVLGNATFTQGDNYLGTCCRVGPVRAGLFATSSSTRVTSGAGYYGNMELSGNVWEYVVSVGVIWPTATTMFAGTHGDGDISTGGYAKMHNSSPWPGVNSSSFVVSGSFSGLRGSSWFQSSPDRARIADRLYAVAQTNGLVAALDYCGRGVRTYDGTDFATK